jgi:hypothetical protein
VDIQAEQEEAEEDWQIDQDILDADKHIKLAEQINVKFVEYKDTYDQKVLDYEEQEAVLLEGIEEQVAAAEEEDETESANLLLAANEKISGAAELMETLESEIIAAEDSYVNLETAKKVYDAFAEKSASVSEASQLKAKE